MSCRSPTPVGPGDVAPGRDLVNQPQEMGKFVLVAMVRRGGEEQEVVALACEFCDQVVPPCRSRSWVRGRRHRCLSAPSTCGPRR